MNFLQKIKEQLGNRERSQGLRNQVIVDCRSLEELVYHFEGVDSKLRSQYGHCHLNEQMSRDIEAVFHNKDSDITLLLIMETLKPMIENRMKERAMSNSFSNKY